MARFAGHHVPALGMTLFAVETGVVLAAARAGWAVGPVPQSGTLAIVVLCAVALQLAFYLADLYDVRVAASDARRGQRLLSALGATFAVAIPATLVAPASIRAAIPLALAAAAVSAAALRAVAPWEPLRRRVYVVGSGRALDALRKELDDGEDLVVAIRDDLPADLADRVRDAGAQLVVTAFDERRGVPSQVLLGCRLQGIEVLEAVTYVERTRRKVPVAMIRPGALTYDDGFCRARIVDAARRVVSIAGALLLLLVFAPLAAVIVPLVRLDSPGPVFYRQVRVGRGGRPFRMWKFRTMRQDAESGTGAVWAQHGDPRVTRVGGFLRRTRLDELPQLVNVIRGDMDLVGPRPERPEFVEELTRVIPYFDVRTLVRPGLTGWAQICYPYGASVDDAREKLAYDLYYVKHASPVLDVIVLFHTAKVVVFGRGAR